MAAGSCCQFSVDLVREELPRGRRDHQRGPLAAVGEEWWVAWEELRACRRTSLIRAQPGLDSDFFASVSFFVPRSGWGPAGNWCVCVCVHVYMCVCRGRGGGWWGVVVCGWLPRGPWRAWKGSLGGQSWWLGWPPVLSTRGAGGHSRWNFPEPPPDWFFLALMFHV